MPKHALSVGKIGAGRRRRDARELKLHHDDVDQHRDRRTPGFDNVVGSLSIQRVSGAIQFAQTPERIGDLQKRALDIVPETSKQVFGRRPKVDHMKARAQGGPVGLPQNGATARRNNTVGRRSEFGNDSLFEVPEAGFPFPLEVVADRAADPLLDHVIAIDEGDFKTLREAPAHCRFAGAGQSDECDRHAVLRTPRVTARRYGR